jgi:hypothetical protein
MEDHQVSRFVDHESADYVCRSQSSSQRISPKKPAVDQHAFIVSMAIAAYRF